MRRGGGGKGPYLIPRSGRLGLRGDVGRKGIPPGNATDSIYILPLQNLPPARDRHALKKNGKKDAKKEEMREEGEG